MTKFKTHIALQVADLPRSVAFYQVLFDLAPVKYKPDYAKFDLDNPGLNLTLNASNTVVDRGTLSHLGIQVDSQAAVKSAIARFKAQGLATFEEHNTDCCYAIQDKVWVTDPDGTRWEIFVVTVADTTPEQNILPETTTPSPCCA